MRFLHIFLVLILLVTTFESAANCTKVTNLKDLSDVARKEGYTANNWAGSRNANTSVNIGLPSVISISSGTFQPSGTLLASSILDFVNQAAKESYSANQILFKCDIADKDSLYEMYSTNGDNPKAGKYSTDEVSGAYYSYVKNVAVRLTNTKTGQYYSRYWQSRPLTSDDYFSDGTNIYVPASAFSGVIFELYRIDGTQAFSNKANVYSYDYSPPNGYIAFKGPGINAPVDGADHKSNYSGWPENWPAAWSLYGTGIKFIRGAMCKVNDYPNLVKLPPISVSELMDGQQSQANFAVSIECEAGAVSNVAPSKKRSSNVSMGFLVNQAAAVSAAQGLGLTTGSGGLTWLLDNHYGAAGVASGVGIRIYNDSNRAINLLPDLSSTGTGNSRGWYAFKDLTSLVSSGNTDIYAGDFTASLERISGQTVTIGTVNAQLQVVVSFQ